MRRLILYGTEGCHLCDEAGVLVKDVLSEKLRGFEWDAVDIAGDEVLSQRYGIRIPVLRDEVSASELAWPFDREQLRRFLGQCLG